MAHSKVIVGVEGPCDHHPGTDKHYHCVTCGCPVWPEDGEHECPPGFDGKPRPRRCCDLFMRGLVCEHLAAELLAEITKLRDEGEPATVAIGAVLDRLDKEKP